MPMREYLSVFVERWRIVVGCVVLGVLVATVFLAVSPSRFQSATTLYIASQTSGDVGAAYEGSRLAEDKVASYVELLSDPRVGEDVSARVPGTAPEQVTAAISASAPPDTSLIRVVVVADSPEMAQRLAATTADVFVGLVTQLEQPTDPRVVPAVVARVLRPASFEASAIAPVPALDLALGLIVGLVVGLLGALVRHAFDTTLKSGDELATLTGAPLLGAVARDAQFENRPIVVQDAMRSPEAEAYRQIRTNLGFLGVDTPHKVFVVTSALPGEGKSVTLCNLAAALGQIGSRVALVDADMRRPMLETYLQIDGAVGLTSVLTGRVAVEEAMQPWRGGLIDVLATGPTPPNPSELLASRRMEEVLTALRDRYDVVLVDAPPIGPVTDAAVLAARVDGVIFVARHGKAPRKDIAAAVGALKVASTPVLGTVFTVQPLTRQRGYGYGAYEAVRTADTSEDRAPDGGGAVPSADGERTAGTEATVDAAPSSSDTPSRPSPRPRVPLTASAATPNGGGPSTSEDRADGD